MSRGQTRRDIAGADVPTSLAIAAMGGNWQIVSRTGPLVPSIGFMLVIERLRRADVVARIDG